MTKKKEKEKIKWADRTAIRGDEEAVQKEIQLNYHYGCAVFLHEHVITMKTICVTWK